MAGLVFEVGRYLGYGDGPYTRGQLNAIQEVLGAGYRLAKAHGYDDRLGYRLALQKRDDADWDFMQG